MKTGSLAIFPLIFTSLAGVSHAASYVNDFSTTPFTTEVTDPQWSLASGTYQNSYTGADTASLASVSVPGVAGTPFTISTQFTINSATAPTASVSTLGFGSFGASATFGGADAASSYYLADFAYANTAGNTDAGRLRILSLGDTSGFTASNTLGNFDLNTSTLAIQQGVTYTLRLTGTYNLSGHLTMSLGLFDSTGTIQYGTSATATDTSPLVGTNFGYRNRTGGGATSALNASFDNYSLQNVPEPSAALLLLAAAGGSALRRKR